MCRCTRETMRPGWRGAAARTAGQYLRMTRISTTAVVFGRTTDPRPGDPTPASGHKPRVLVVDDSRSFRQLLCRHLEVSGYEVITAVNGREAVQIICREGIQLVLTDWEMPEMDGLELCRAIRSGDSIGFVFIIILTAHADKSKLLEAFDAGADDFLTKPFDRQELLARMRAGERIIALEHGLEEQTRAIHKANAELAVLNESLERMATTDELTSLANRRHALDQLDRDWAFSTRHNQPLSCIGLDLDHFKKVNDTYGHAAGDAVLKEVSAALRAHSRTCDLVCRMGGEELLILCPNTDAAGAAILAERCRRVVEELRVEDQGRTIRFTISIGVAERDPSMATREDLLHAADEALYAAKAAGRNCVRLAGRPAATALAGEK